MIWRKRWTGMKLSENLLKDALRILRKFKIIGRNLRECAKASAVIVNF